MDRKSVAVDLSLAINSQVVLFIIEAAIQLA